MKSILVIGMGILGRHLAGKMQSLGNEVLIVDKDEDIIQELSIQFPNSIAGDCTNEDVLRSIGVNNFEECFVAIGEDFYASLEITSILKDLGAKHVISKAKLQKQAEFLRKIGADEVFSPEKEIAERLAMRFTADNIYDYVELTEEYSIFEIPILKQWIGKALMDIDVRNKYHINIIAVKNTGFFDQMPGGEYVFKDGDHIVVIGQANTIFKLTAKL